MKLKLSPQRRSRAFTAGDLMICLFTVVLLAGVFVPLSFGRTKAKAGRITCVSNLKQIGLSFRMWSNSHRQVFPWNVEGTNGGSKEFSSTGEVWQHYQTVSNELNTPKVLVCPDDSRNRQKVTDWRSFTNNSHLSYFVGLDADETMPQTILSGDRNLTSSTSKPVKGVFNITPNDRVEWTKAIHNQAGNVGLADGSAHQFTSQQIDKQFKATVASTFQAFHRIALPE